MSISTYYLPACPSLQPVTVTSVLNPLLGQLALQCDTVLSRMRASSLQRTAILQPKANRERVRCFYFLLDRCTIGFTDNYDLSID